MNDRVLVVYYIAIQIGADPTVLFWSIIKCTVTRKSGTGGNLYKFRTLFCTAKVCAYGLELRADLIPIQSLPRS